MYSTCINCHAPLGANEMLERFPVGRKLAFDAAKGRLWVVCRACRQWNLSPLEERWEAIEEGEKLYRDTRLRASTDNVGLARLKDGTELIRIGVPQRPEFAAWRYGERFTRRWIINAPGAAVASVAGGVMKYGGVQWIFRLGIVPGASILGLGLAVALLRKRRTVAQIKDADGERILLTQAHLETMRIVPDDDEPDGWYLRLRRPPAGSGNRWFRAKDPELIVRGAEAARVAAKLLPRVNHTGGRKATVAEAVTVLERHGSAAAVFRKASRYDVEAKKHRRYGRFDEIESDDDKPSTLSEFAKAPAPIRLAVEMAAHEEQERELMAGELEHLEAQWKEAEEVAAISDELTLPPTVLERLERLRLR